MSETNAVPRWALYDTDLITRIAYIPALTSRAYFEWNEPGSFELTVAENTDIADLFEIGQGINLEYRDESIYEYAGGGGWVIEKIEKIIVNNEEYSGRVVKILGRGFLALFDDAIVWNDGSGETTREITGTYGAIFTTLFAEAQARGGLSALTLNFDGTNDSGSVAWSESVTLNLQVGQSLLELLRDWFAEGLSGYIQLNGSDLDFTLYQSDWGSNYSSIYYMRIGTNAVDVTNKSESDALKNAYLVKYADGWTQATDSTSITNYRRREDILRADVAPNVNVANTFAGVSLNDNKNPLSSITLQVSDAVKPWVVWDYFIGDTISVDNMGTITAHKIYGITLEFDGDSIPLVTLDLDSPGRIRSLEVERRLRRLESFWAAAADDDKQAAQFWANIGVSPDNYIYAYKVSGEYLYVGGGFTTIGGIAANSIARLHIPTGVWSALGTGLDGNCLCLEVIGSDLYAGGSFVSAGGTSVIGIAKWNGSAWSILGSSGINSENDPVWCMAKNGTDLYIGGEFSSVNGVTTEYVAKWDGASWSSLGDLDDGAAGVVIAMYHDGSNLYVAGAFAKASPLMTNVAKHNGTSWSSWGTRSASTETMNYGAIKAIGTDLYLGGASVGAALTNIGGVTGNSLYKWNGSAWSAVTTGVNDGIYAMDTDGIILLIGGVFTTAGGYTANRIAVYNTVNFYTLTTGLNAAVRAVAIYGLDYYVGGTFTTAGGKTIPSMAAYLTTLESVNNYLEQSAYGSFNMAGAIHGATAKSAFVDADEVGFWDSVSSKLRKITWANIKATLIASGLTLAYVAKTANYTIATTDTVIDCTSNSFDLTLPTAVGISGKVYYLKNSGTGTITLKTTSSQTIDGQASGAITLIQYESYTVQSNGANWIII